MIKIKKILPIVILSVVLLLGTTAFAGTAFHDELETALVTDMSLSDAMIETTVRIGAKGESYTLDLAAVYNPEDAHSVYGVKGLGPSFSLKGWGVQFTLDGFVWPNQYAKASLKYRISDMVNMGVFAQSDLSWSYDFGMLMSIEY